MQTETAPPPDTAAPQPEATEPRPAEPRRTPVINFARHYAEMVVAMLLGMFVLGFALSALLEAAGVDVSSWDTEAPALLLLGMAFTMTVPMVAWMRHRRHEWARCREMTAAMFVPSFAAIGLLWSSAMTGGHELMMIQHVGMFPSMLIAMLLRREAYTGH